MREIESAGIILSRRLDTLPTQVLLGHSTGKDAPGNFASGKWGILKGKFDPGETPWECAKREFYEESGLKIDETEFLSVVSDENGMPAPWVTYSLYTKEKGEHVKKYVYVFWIIDKKNLTKNFEFKCQSFVKSDGRPEIDEYVWTTPHSASTFCMKSQKEVFEKLHEIVSSIR